MTVFSLVFYSPDAQTWQYFPLPDSHQGLTISIGRDAQNDLVLNDFGVSANHALLSISPQGMFILDQNSRNGIMVAGNLITPNQWVPFTLGATLTLGNTLLRLETTASETVVSPRSASPPQSMIDQPLTESPPQAQVNPPSIAPPSQSLNFQPPISPSSKQSKKKRFPTILLVVGVVIFIAIAGSVLLFSKGDRIRGLPRTGSDLSASHLLDENLILDADGKTQTDANGVSITIPDGALIGASAELATFDLNEELAQDMMQGYEVISPAYELTAQGAADGAEPAWLAFPAEDDEMRLMTIIDGTYAAELTIVPQNGQLTVFSRHPSLGCRRIGGYGFDVAKRQHPISVGTPQIETAGEHAFLGKKGRSGSTEHAQYLQFID